MSPTLENFLQLRIQVKLKDVDTQVLEKSESWSDFYK